MTCACVNKLSLTSNGDGSQAAVSDGKCWGLPTSGTRRCGIYCYGFKILPVCLPCVTLLGALFSSRLCALLVERCLTASIGYLSNSSQHSICSFCSYLFLVCLSCDGLNIRRFGKGCIHLMFTFFGAGIVFVTENFFVVLCTGVPHWGSFFFWRHGLSSRSTLRAPLALTETIDEMLRDVVNWFPNVVFLGSSVPTYRLQIPFMLSSTGKIFVYCVFFWISFVIHKRFFVTQCGASDLCSGLWRTLCFWSRSYFINWDCVVKSLDINHDSMRVHLDGLI